MGGPNPLSSVRNLFSPKARARSETGSQYQRQASNPPEPQLFADALYQHIDAHRHEQSAASKTIRDLFKIFPARLKPRGPVQNLARSGNDPVRARKTGFSNIFSNTRGGGYQVVLDDHQVLPRSDAEVKTHVLIESHLKHAYGDASISEKQVICEAEVDHKRSNGFFASLRNKRRRVDMSAQAEQAEPAMPARSAARTVPAAARRPQRATAAAPAVAVPAPPLPRNPAQETTLQFIEDHKGLKPLAFMEAMTVENPELGGYIAMRLRKMRTPVGPVLEHKRPFIRSAYPGILVSSHESTEMIESVRLRFDDDAKHAQFQQAAPPGGLAMALLLDDLKTEIERQNRAVASGQSATGPNAGGVFPLGIAAAINPATPPMASTAAGGNAHVRSMEAVSALLDMPDTAGPAEDQWLASLSASHPAAAGFVAFMEEGLLLQDVSQDDRCERFRYVDDILPLIRKGLQNAGPDNIAWAPTFIDGIERNPVVHGTDPGTWRIRHGDAWVIGSSKQEILRHLTLQALNHLQADAPASGDMPIFPLCAYEMLAHATGQPIPQYLQDHEAALHTKVAGNQDALAARRQHQAEVSRQTAIENAETKQRVAAQCIENKVSSVIQLVLCKNGHDPAKITAGSVEANLSLMPSRGTQMEVVRNIQAQLAPTHSRQAVSYRSPSGADHDNKCWLRSAWLSLLAAATPEALEQRLGKMQANEAAPIRACECAPARLGHIAQQFKADPVAFLHGPQAQNGWTEALGNPAALGHAFSVSDATSIERTLQNVLKNVATGFRFENDKIMRELESTLSPGAMASTDMAMTLHRGFNVPALIVEVGAPVYRDNGERDVTASHVRIAAPKGSALEARVAAFAEKHTNLADDPAALQALLAQFSDLPIIWFEQEHQEVYLPNSLINSFNT